MTKSAKKKLAIVGGISVTVLGLGVLVLLLLARNPERRVAKLLTEAQIHKRTDRLDLEGKCLDEALAIMPRDAGLMAKVARNAEARHDLERAESLFRASLDANPDSISVGFDFYDVLVARGKLDEAAHILEKVEKQAQVAAPEAYRDRVLTGRADLALRRGERTSAIASLRNALQVNPVFDSGVRLALASVLAQEGQLVEAEELARTLWAVRRPKDLPAPKDDQEKLGQEARFCNDIVAGRAALSLGGLLIQRGAVDDAALVLAEGWERSPEDAEVALTLASAEIARGRSEAALEVGKKLEAKRVQGLALVVRARVALAKNDKETARKDFTDAANVMPGAPMPALAAARCAIDAGDKEAAKKLALSIDTKLANLDERVHRCRILRDAGDTKTARAELDPILASSPGNASAIDLLIRLAMEEGKVELASKELDTLEKRAPGNRNIQRARTVLALWGANPAEAVKLSQESVASGTDAGSLPILTAALALEGGVAAAVKELEAISERATDDKVRVRARLQAAELYRALGRGDLAVPILERSIADHPLTKEPRLALGRLFLSLERSAEAEKVVAPLLDGAGEP
ncbi:MAG: tetratricopeptide repeat protein, partial [Planctomycetota bacterium]